MSHRVLQDRSRVLGRLALLVGLQVLVTASGCSGGNGSTTLPPLLGANFSPSGTAPASDMVLLEGTTSGDIVTVDVVLGGPTTSSDLYSFAFDLELGDPTVAVYMNGSATFGSALTTSGGQQSQVLAIQNGDRITVGVSKLGGGSGNGVSGERVVVSLNFRVVKSGVTSLTLTGNAPSPAALDSGGTVVGTVQFDGTAASISGS